MSKPRPYILSIAGYDPSAGAGVLADIKTFEAHRTNGFAVVSSITCQNENEFLSCDWIEIKQIKKQLVPLFKIYKIDYVKIGLIENISVLNDLVNYLLKQNPDIKIIWDPILKASAGFEFHNDIEKLDFEKICKKIFLITPNWIEIQKIYPAETALEGAKQLSGFCNVFLKGGHNEENKGRDYLFAKEKVQNFRPKKISEYSKHGSGCVLSSAITANLAKGYRLDRACLKAKDYITEFLDTNKTRLGYHKF